MEQSILTSTKKILGIGPDDASFDLDVITHINSAFSTLTDLGVGPDTGFVIEDDTAVWEDFFYGDVVKMSKVKTCVYLHTRLAFDPPTSSYLLNATQEQLQEAMWRISVNRENEEWVDPDPPEVEVPVVEDRPVIIDGGGV